MPTMHQERPIVALDATGLMHKGEEQFHEREEQDVVQRRTSVAVTARDRFQASFEQGKNVLGTMITSVDPLVTGVVGQAGFDFVILDMEHGYMSLETAQRHILAARAEGLTVIVRVLENSATRVQAVLDIGADGVISPKIGSAEDAALLARAARYQSGGRGACQGTFAANFTFAGWKDYVAATNENVLTVPLLETRLGVENADEIAAVEGIDVLFFGPVDFAQDYGCDYRDPVVRDAWETVRDAAHRHGKWALASTFTAEGADILVDGMDLMFLRTAAEQIVAGHANSRSLALA